MRLCHNSKKPTSCKGERGSGGKDLERRPLNVRILASQAFEYNQLYTSDDFPYLKDPYSKSLEPDRLSPQCAIETQLPPLHSWNVSVEEAIRIQEALKDRIILKNTISKVTTIGGADAAYSKNGNLLFGAIVVLSFPEMEVLDSATAEGKTLFPYIPGLLSFREGPILVKAFQKLRLKPDIVIFDGQGIAHPRGMGLASHMGLWLNLPSIGCAKTPLFGEFVLPGNHKGSSEWIRRKGKKVGAVLRTRDNIKPLFISPGHGVDFVTSNQIILDSCNRFRYPEPLRKAHQLAQSMLHRR
jgi:deoxyribonuclease V